VILTRLRRGLLAGLVAGLLAGLFGFALGEPVLDRAVELEEHTHDEEHADDAVFNRGEQKAGLFVATALYSTAVGGVFGLVSAYFRGRVSLRGEWAHGLALAGAIFAGFVLLPFLKYPPNPPGVGADPETLTARTVAYLAMAALSLLSTFFAWRLARELEGFAAPVRHLLIGAFLLFSWGLLLALMPGFGGSGDAPAELVWSFRLSSLGMQAVLWIGLGCAFGLLGERAETRVGRAASTVVAEGEPH
jgi:predicted cobalt transporter CbtA